MSTRGRRNVVSIGRSDCLGYQTDDDIGIPAAIGLTW
jgi:hypothetical protein